MKACVVCERETELRGVACPPCDAVLLVFSLIERHWLPAEMEQLRDSLRADSTAGLAMTARERGATLMVKLLWHIQALAPPAGLQADDLKRRVCDRLTKRAVAQRQIEKYESQNGPDSYRLMVVQWISAELGRLSFPHRRMPEPTEREAASMERSAVVTLAARFGAAAENVERERPQLVDTLGEASRLLPRYEPEEYDPALWQ